MKVFLTLHALVFVAVFAADPLSSSFTDYLMVRHDDQAEANDGRILFRDEINSTISDASIAILSSEGRIELSSEHEVCV